MTVRAAAASALAAVALLAAAPFAGAQSSGGAVVRTEPGSAPAAGVFPTGTDTSPLITYGALALSGLAAVLGAAALTTALLGRRRADELAEALRARPASTLDPRSADRISRLETAVRELAAAPPRRVEPEPRTASREPFPPPAPPARPSPGSPPVAAPVAAPPAERLAAWVDELTASFARLALDPSFAAAGFIADHAPRGALAGPDGVALLDAFEGAKLWAVRAPGPAEVWALTPGEQAVLNWSAHFADQRTQVAAEVFGEAFDLVDGGTGLRLEEPALLRRDPSGRLSVRRRGRLSGFRG